MSHTPCNYVPSTACGGVVSTQAEWFSPSLLPSPQRAFAIEVVSHKVVRLRKCDMHTHQQNRFSKSTEGDIVQTTHYKRRGDVWLPAGALSKRRALPETSNLPSVFMFAECIPSGTRQINSLPSAILKTLGKKNTRQRWDFVECQTKNTRQIGVLPSVTKNTRQKGRFAECPKITLGKAKKCRKKPTCP